MKKRFLSALLAVILCVTLAPGSLTVDAAYSDVPTDHWSVPSIDRATELGIFNGVGGGQFGFGQAISRAAFTTALVRMFGWESVTPGKATFTDVTPGIWYYSAVETAVANGAIAVTAKTFRPEESLSRGEMTAMLMRALGYTSLAGVVSSYSCPFTDVTTNKGFITLAYDMGIVSGMGNGTFAPDSYATREQAAAILVRLYDRLNAGSAELTTTEGWTEIRVKTPEAAAGSTLPTTPLEPVTQLYDQLRAMKNSWQDMSQVVLVLCGGGVMTIVSNEGAILSSKQISKDELDLIFEEYQVRTYYSQRYESAYCTYVPNEYQQVTVWYQSEESLSVKLQLARMFGVTKYVLE